MADPKKASRRLTAPSSASSQKKAAAGSSASSRGVVKSSQRMPVGAKKPAPPPEPEVPEEEPILAGEPLFDEDDEIEPQKPKAIDADPALLSEDSLYSDEDPLEKLREQKKAGIRKPAPSAGSGISGKNTTAVRPSAKSTPAAPAKNTTSSVMKVAPVSSASSKGSKPMPAASGKSSKAVPPVLKRAPEPEPELEDEEPVVPEEAAAPEATEEAPAESEAVEPVESEEAPAKKSARQSQVTRQTLKATQRLKTASGKATARLKEVDAEEEEDEPRISRRTTKRSIRADAPKGPPKKLMILGGIIVIAALVVGIGYRPFMRSWYIKTLDAPDSGPAARKSAVEALYKKYTADAFVVFSAKERLASDDASIREAVAHGLGLLAGGRLGGTAPVDRLAEEYAGAANNKDARVLYIKTLNEISGELRENKTGTKAEKEAPAPDSEADTKSLTKIASTLITASSSSEADGEIRMLAVAGLSELRLPGVCVQLLKLATEEKGELRNRALTAVPYTALPDTIGDLLHAMQSEDKTLAETAKKAFINVRDKAKSDDLFKLINDPSLDVRREIVEALGSRKGDPKATDGITVATKDKDASIRTLAVKAVPTTGVSGGNVNQLLPLVTDSDEGVRVATAESLAQLRDPDSYKLILGAFKNGFEGRTLDAYTKALGRRSYGKDLKACEILIGLLNSNPAGERTIREALVLVTNNNQGEQRNGVRRGWSTEKWKQWYTTISDREKMREDVRNTVGALKKQMNADRTTFPQLFKKVEAEIEKLEKCVELSKPDDAEDVSSIEKDMHEASTLKEYFNKGAAFDFRN